MEEIVKPEGEVVRSEAMNKDYKQIVVVEEDSSPPSYEKIYDEARNCQIPDMINTPIIQDNLVQGIEKMIPGQFGQPAKSIIDIEIQKVEIKRQQFLKEKELTEEILKAKERILEAEMKLALSKLEDLSFSDNMYGTCHNNHWNIYSNASAPPEISVDPNLIQSPTNHIASVPSSNLGAVGLDQLALLESVKITHASSSGVNETHHVVTPDNSVVLRADITLGWIDQVWVRRRPVQKGECFDGQNQEVVKFRPFKSRKMEVQVGKEKSYILKLKSTFIKPVVTVKDKFGNVLLKIKGQGISGNTAVFSIETVSKLRIGCISKNLDDSSQNIGSSSIHFPWDLDIGCKTAIIICSFLIVTKAQAKMRERRMYQALLGTLIHCRIQMCKNETNFTLQL